MLDIYLTHRAALVDYATPIVGDRMRAEDVVQEAFIRFVPAEGRPVPAMEQPVAYLYRIVRNLALDLTRRRSMETRRQAEPEPLWWMMPAKPRTPEEETLHHDDLSRIEAALARLPERSRRALEMHRFGGHTMREIADRLGVSEPSVHRMVHKALVEIARHVGPDAEN
ncbi:MAG: sigma-70 family RNA polymerase sigma factor [Rhodospirillales bacterium]